MIFLGSGRPPRAVKQFSSMIRARTLLSMTDLNGYGNYCGLRGSGIPVDEIDR